MTLAYPAHDARFDALEARLRQLGISAPWIGTTGGSELKLGNARAIPLGELTAAHESWFPDFMGN